MSKDKNLCRTKAFPYHTWIVWYPSMSQILLEPILKLLKTNMLLSLLKIKPHSMLTNPFESKRKAYLFLERLNKNETILKNVISALPSNQANCLLR